MVNQKREKSSFDPIKHDWISEFAPDISGLMLYLINKNPQACFTNIIPEGTGKYGYSPTNPIPTFGMGGNLTYLDSLTPNVEMRPIFKKKGCIMVDNINMPVDEYEVYTPHGQFVTNLYLSPYHYRTSRLAPEGFYLQNQQD